MKRIFSIAVLASAVAMASAQDTYQWTFNAGDLATNDTAGKLLNATGTFNTVTNQFSWYGTYAAQNGVLPNGFWLAVSPGPNPKGSSDELAIFYLDGTGSPDVYVYGYNGVNGNTSYYDGSNASGTQAPDKIASSDVTPGIFSDITVQNNPDGTRTLGFTMDATVVQNHTPAYGNPANWTGAAFGDKIGIWWHPVAGLSTSTQSGYLKSYSFHKQGWLDTNDQNTELVPEPASMIALGLGLAAFARRRRNK